MLDFGGGTCFIPGVLTCYVVCHFWSRCLALEGWAESQMFHPNTIWFHLLLWDFRQQDFWFVLQGCQVCLYAFPVREMLYEWSLTDGLIYPTTSTVFVTSQRGKVWHVCSENSRGNLPPHLLISWHGCFPVCGNTPWCGGAQHQHQPLQPDGLCGGSL